jgi:hypothetical protein
MGSVNYGTCAVFPFIAERNYVYCRAKGVNGKYILISRVQGNIVCYGTDGLNFYRSQMIEKALNVPCNDIIYYNGYYYLSSYGRSGGERIYRSADLNSWEVVLSTTDNTLVLVSDGTSIICVSYYGTSWWRSVNGTDWTRYTGSFGTVGIGDGYNGVYALSALNSGRQWISTNGGLSFTQTSAPPTSSYTAYSSAITSTGKIICPIRSNSTTINVYDIATSSWDVITTSGLVSNKVSLERNSARTKFVICSETTGNTYNNISTDSGATWSVCASVSSFNGYRDGAAMEGDAVIISSHNTGQYLYSASATGTYTITSPTFLN